MINADVALLVLVLLDMCTDVDISSEFSPAIFVDVGAKLFVGAVVGDSVGRAECVLVSEADGLAVGVEVGEGRRGE